MNKKILMSGNEAMAEGAIAAGCQLYAGYPITPQNELIAHMAKRMPQLGRIFIQAESELAAINMVFGASVTGARAMTSSSSPGISLKQEGISYLAGAQLPAVIVNVMRAGPGLGDVTPSQSDYFQAVKGGGHGDYHSIVLAPATVGEAYKLMGEAFDFADTYRNPVMVLADGILGQMMEPVQMSDDGCQISDKNKKLKSEHSKPWALTGCKGRKPNMIRSLYMVEGELERLNLILQKKYKVIRQKEQRYESCFLDDAKVIVVAYGTMARIAKSAVSALREKGLKVGLIRPITLWPFPERIFAQLQRKKKNLKVLVVEMSYGQMVEDVKLSLNCRFSVDFLGRAGGGILSEEAIIKKVKSLLR